MTFEDCGELGEAIEVFLEAFARAAADPATAAAAAQLPADACQPGSQTAGDFFAALGENLSRALSKNSAFLASLAIGVDIEGGDHAERFAVRLGHLAAREARRAVVKRMGGGVLFGVQAVRLRVQELRLAELIGGGASLPEALAVMGISRATAYRTLARLRARGVSI